MSIEENKAALRRFYEADMSGLTDALVDELFAPDYIGHDGIKGREGVKQQFRMRRSALPAGVKFDREVEHMVAEGDYVVTRIAFRVAYAGKEATASELSESRLANGKIVESWPPSGVMALLQQVGITLPSR